MLFFCWLFWLLLCDGLCLCQKEVVCFIFSLIFFFAGGCNLQIVSLLIIISCIYFNTPLLGHGGILSLSLYHFLFSGWHSFLSSSQKLRCCIIFLSPLSSLSLLFLSLILITSSLRHSNIHRDIRYNKHLSKL